MLVACIELEQYNIIYCHDQIHSVHIQASDLYFEWSLGPKWMWQCEIVSAQGQVSFVPTPHFLFRSVFLSVVNFWHYLLFLRQQTSFCISGYYRTMPMTQLSTQKSTFNQFGTWWIILYVYILTRTSRSTLSTISWMCILKVFLSFWGVRGWHDKICINWLIGRWMDGWMNQLMYLALSKNDLLIVGSTWYLDNA